MNTPKVKARDLLSVETRLNVLYAALMSAFMALILSAVMLLVNLGFEQFDVDRWMHSYMIAWPLAFTLVLVIGPVIRRLVMSLVQAHEE